MITGVKKTEKEYRAILSDSSSSLKDFSMDRKKYYKKYILGETIAEKENQAVNMGKLVECILLEKEEFDNKFYLSTCTSVPGGLMNTFIEELYVLSVEATDNNGVLTKDFEELSRKAYEAAGYKITYEAVIKSFVSKNKSGDIPQEYYEEIRIVRPKNLTVVTTQDVTNAENIVSELQNNFVTRDIINLQSNDRFTILTQYQIEEFTFNNHRFKSMLDKIIIDHKLKTIQPIDIKCTWNVENFYEEYYLYRRAYIQAIIYYYACMSLTNPGRIYEGYTVNYLQFLVCDSINYMNPLIFTLTQEDMEDCFYGFSHKNKDYPGVNEIIENLDWAQQNNIWNINKNNYLANGCINIKS